MPLIRRIIRRIRLWLVKEHQHTAANCQWQSDGSLRVVYLCCGDTYIIMNAKTPDLRLPASRYGVVFRWE